MAVAERELNGEYVNPVLGVTLEEYMSKNDGLIKSIAQLYYGRVARLIPTIEFEDLYQIAAMAVVESYKRFKQETKNVDFKKHVTTNMHLKIDRFLNFKARTVHVSIGKRMKGETVTVIPMDKKVERGGTETEVSNFFEAKPYDETEYTVSEFLSTLDERTRTVLKLRMEGKDLKCIAAVLGVTNTTVRNIAVRARPLWKEWNAGTEV